MNKQDIQTVLEALANLHDKTSPVCFEAYGDSIDEAYANAHKAIAILIAALAEPKQSSNDLSNRLRDTASKGVSVWGDLQMEAAKEIEILTAERECYASAMDRMKAALAEPSEAVAWQLGHRFYTSLKDAEYAWRNDCAFLGTSYVPEPLFTHPASKPEPDWLLVSTTSLAMSLWRRHFKDEAPDWKPLPDFAGVISQIDNMVCGLVKPSKPEPLTADEVWKSDAIMAVNASMDVKMNDLMKLVSAIEQAVWEKMK